MTHGRKLQKRLALLKTHWAVTAWLAVVALFGGVKIIIEGYNSLVAARTPVPQPDVIQVEAVPDDSDAYAPDRARWAVTVENPSDRPLSITRAHFEVRQYPRSAGAEYASAVRVNLSRNVYRLPLDCHSGNGSRPLVPPFPVPPKGSASLVIEGERKEVDCFFRLSFETTQGITRVMTAEPVDRLDPTQATFP